MFIWLKYISLLLSVIPDQGNHRCCQKNTVGRKSDKIQNHEIEDGEHGNGKQKAGLERASVVLKAKNRDGIYKIGDYGQKTHKAAVVEVNAEHNGDQDKEPLDEFVSLCANGKKVSEKIHAVLNGRAVAFKHNAAGGVKHLAHGLNEQDAFEGLFCGAYGIRNGSKQR
jgi:hypothetical protein